MPQGGIRTRNHGLRAIEECSCLRPLGYRDRPPITLPYSIPKALPEGRVSTEWESSIPYLLRYWLVLTIGLGTTEQASYLRMETDSSPKRCFK
jgi:hypothetical protein